MDFAGHNNLGPGALCILAGKKCKKKGCPRLVLNVRPLSPRVDVLTLLARVNLEKYKKEWNKK